MIDIIKINDLKYRQERARCRKRLQPDSKGSNFRLYEPMQPKRIIKPQFFKFDNIPAQPETLEKLPTPTCNDSKEPLMYPLDSSKNFLAPVSPIGGMFHLASPSDRYAIPSARSYAFPNSTRALFSPTYECFKQKSPTRAWDDDDAFKAPSSTKDRFLAEMIAIKNGGINAIPDPSESPADIKKPIPISPNANIAGKILNMKY